MQEKFAGEKQENSQTLGEYLWQARLGRGLELRDIAAETGISLANLTAMEEDHYQALPAAVFTRGFYTIYAKVLGLEPESVLERYRIEAGEAGKIGKREPFPPISGKSSKEAGYMAGRPKDPPFALFFLTFITILLLIALGCMYYSVNPACFISKKLRSLQKTYAQADLPASAKESAMTAAEHEEAARYLVEASFFKFTTLQVDVDNTEFEQVSVQAGETLSWSARQMIKIVIPEETGAVFFLNGETVELPEAENGTITIILPKNPAD